MADLASVLAIPDFEERRAELRKLAMPILESGLTKEKIANAYVFSPIVGAMPDQVEPRTSVSGLRDMLDEDTLAALIHGAIQPDDILEAIKSPEAKSVESERSKTGFIFGRPSFRKRRASDRPQASPYSNRKPRKENHLCLKAIRWQTYHLTTSASLLVLA
jgi:hypothetical protein